MINFRKKIKKKVENSSKARQGSKTKGTERCISRCENFARCISRCEFLSRKGGNFAHLKTRCEIESKVRNPLFKVRIPQMPFSHTTVQGAKIFAPCEIPYSKCESSKCNFRTPLFKVRKFSHHAKHPLGTRVEFRTPQAKFRTVRNKVQNFRTVRNWVRNAKQGANSSIQSMEISHDAIQGAKFPVQGAKISHGKIWSSKNFKLTFKLKFYPRNCA